MKATTHLVFFGLFFCVFCAIFASSAFKKVLKDKAP